MNTKKLLIGIALVATLVSCTNSKNKTPDGLEQVGDTSSPTTSTDSTTSTSTDAEDLDKDLNSIQMTDPTQELLNSEK